VDRDTPAREHAGRGYKVPNGGIYSTVGDLARFVAAMSGARGDSLLRAETRRTVLTAAGPANMAPASATRGYGLGFDVQALPGGRRIAGHGGSVAGYTAYLAFDPDARVGVILLRNYNQGRTPLGEAANALVTELVRAGTGTGGH
jgi:CubicO group peptidase (beta-lactamase class C family)